MIDPRMGESPVIQGLLTMWRRTPVTITELVPTARWTSSCPCGTESEWAARAGTLGEAGASMWYAIDCPRCGPVAWAVCPSGAVLEGSLLEDRFGNG